MITVEIVIALLTVIVALVVAAQRFKIPYPIVLVIGGTLLGFIPGLPLIHLNPHIVFLLFVPPVLSAAGYFISLRDFRANIRPIALLAIVLVTVTTFAVAAAFKLLMPNMPWIVGCVLGAIIAPPDAVAATTIMRNLKIPRRVITILEGESLFNDASALILYRFAVAAAVTGTFSLPQAALTFLFMGIGGVALGFLFGWITVQALKHLEETVISITFTLLIPFLVYIVAEKIVVSGILAVVIYGIVLGWYDPIVISPQKRIKGRAVWETYIFLLNSLAFALMGLQFPIIWQGLGNWSFTELFLLAIVTLIVAIIVRFLWAFFSAYGIRAIFPRIRRYDPYPAWQAVVVIAWSGMRGIVSLGAALALPLTTLTGTNFPGRDLIIFLTFTTIFGTLVLQGMTLPILIKILGLKADDALNQEERSARELIGKSMMLEIETLKSKDNISKRAYEIASRECILYATSQSSDVDKAAKDCAREIRRVRLKMIAIGRQRLLELRKDGAINDEIYRNIQNEFDLDEVRLSQ